MSVRGKRGLSPVIATVLLVAIALVLAIIIFLWARSFIGEAIEKDGRDIQQSCELVSFDAEVNGGQVAIVNRGRVSLYGVEIREKKAIGSITQFENFDGSIPILSGESGRVDLPGGIIVGSGSEIIIVPVLLGETDDFKKPYTCDADYGVETTV